MKKEEEGFILPPSTEMGVNEGKGGPGIETKMNERWPCWHQNGEVISAGNNTRA